MGLVRSREGRRQQLGAVSRRYDYYFAYQQGLLAVSGLSGERRDANDARSVESPTLGLNLCIPCAKSPDNWRVGGVTVGGPGQNENGASKCAQHEEEIREW